MFYLLLFLLAITSADIIFHKFLVPHSTLSEKKVFRHEFSVFNRFTQSPTLPPQWPEFAKRCKSFLLMLPYCHLS